jgi:hypothetical protein
MKAATVAVALLASTTGAAHAAGKNDMVFGVGVKPCSEFLQALKTNRSSQYTLWTLGYVSSLSRDSHGFAATGEHAAFVARFQQEIYSEGKGYAAFEYRMRQRCEGVPSEPYEDALWSEIQSMNGAAS